MIKNEVEKKRRALRALTLALAALVAAAAVGARAPGDAGQLRGTWYMALDTEPFGMPAGTSLPGLATFHRNGSFQIVDGGDLGGLPFPTRDTAQFGSWRRQGRSIVASSLFLQADAISGEVQSWQKIEFALTADGPNRLAGTANVFELACRERTSFRVLGCPNPVDSAVDFVPVPPFDIPVHFELLRAMTAREPLPARGARASRLPTGRGSRRSVAVRVDWLVQARRQGIPFADPDFPEQCKVGMPDEPFVVGNINDNQGTLTFGRKGDDPVDWVGHESDCVDTRTLKLFNGRAVLRFAELDDSELLVHYSGQVTGGTPGSFTLEAEIEFVGGTGVFRCARGVIPISGQQNGDGTSSFAGNGRMSFRCGDGDGDSDDGDSDSDSDD